MMNIENFCKSDLRKKLHIKIIENENAMDYGEYYHGIRRNEQTCIMEPTEPALTTGRGTPKYYLATTDRDICKHFKDEFDDKWNLVPYETNYWDNSKKDVSKEKRSDKTINVKNSSKIEDLERLSTLKTNGIITETEFTNMKNDIFKNS